MKPTTGHVGPRDPGPHGITRLMLLVPKRRQERHPKLDSRVGAFEPYSTQPTVINPDKDRRLACEARIRARRAAKAATR